MKKIVHLTSVHDPFDTRIFYKELQTLARANYAVTLIAPHERDEIVEGLQIRAIQRVPGKFKRVLTAGWHLIRAALREDADIYHIHDPELLLWSQILRLRGRQVVYDMHENVPQSIRRKTWIPPLMRRPLAGAYRLLERLLLLGMPVIFAENSYVPDYRWHDGPQVVVLNMPLANQLLAIKAEAHPQPTLGYVGDVKPWRGSTVTLEALNLLKQRGSEVDWDCVGQITEAHRQEMEQFARQHNLHGVRLHGRLRPEVWQPMIARCQIGLAVLAPEPNYVQSYPTKLFEYMALGIPVIASGFPLYREIVEGAGCGLLLNDPTDPYELADSIKYLLDHPDEAAAMGQRGRDAVRDHFRWEVEGDKLLDFYARLLG